MVFMAILLVVKRDIEALTFSRPLRVVRHNLVPDIPPLRLHPTLSTKKYPASSHFDFQWELGSSLGSEETRSELGDGSPLQQPCNDNGDYKNTLENSTMLELLDQIMDKSDDQVSQEKSVIASGSPQPANRNIPSRRPLVRIIDNFWFVMCTPFPDLRKLSRKRDNDAKDVVNIRLRDGFAVVLAYLALGVVSYRYIFERWSFVDALYFTCVCFSTVGYGDIVPKSVAGKFFSCLFGLSGIALLGAAVARIGSRLVEAERDAAKQTRKKTQKALLQIYDRMPRVVRNLRRSSQNNRRSVIQEARELLSSIPHPHFPPALATFWKATRFILQSLLAVALGGLVIGYLEGWKWYDGLYFGVVTASTIGLGDIAPQTNAGKLATVIFIPLSVAAAGEILASVGLAIVERRQRQVFRTQLNKGLTMETLQNMDANRDGKVVREEYVSYMLMEMGLVTKEELEELWKQFERLDATKSGHLDHDDLLLMAKLREAGLVESSP